ncbi:MAG: hypothetical protein ABI254_12735, partial [Chthoniobacterales bacterium]
MSRLYRSIGDALDTVHTYGEKYSLHLKGDFEAWPRNAFFKLDPQSIPRAQELPFLVMVKAQDLKVEGHGDMCVELGIYLPQEGRHPDDVAPEPDQRIQLKLPEGTYDWQELSAKVSIPVEATALLVRVGGKGFSGEVWIGSPRLCVAEEQWNYLSRAFGYGHYFSALGGDSLIPPLIPENAHWDRFNWLGQNLSRVEWPDFELRVDGKLFFKGPLFNPNLRNADFEVLLPALEEGKHEILLTYVGDYDAALPFVIGEIEILQESTRALEVVAYPEYVAADREFSVLVEVNEAESSRLEVVKIPAGVARAKSSFEVSANGQTETIRPQRVVQHNGSELRISSGDSFHVSQNLSDFMRFFVWYLENGIGNALEIRPLYRWCGSRETNPELWKLLVPLLEQMGMSYHLIKGARELPGTNNSPSDTMLSGPNYLGSQWHEMDAAYNYSGGHPATGLFLDIFRRMVTLPGADPYAYSKDGLVLFDPLEATNMKEAATMFTENLYKVRGGKPMRHTGPTVLFHYFYESGYDWVGSEQMYGPEEIKLAALRGASKAYGKPDYGAHLAMEWNSSPMDTGKHAERYFHSLASCYLQGVTGVNTEDGLWRMACSYAPYDRFSHACEIHRDAHTRFRRFVETHPRRGIMHVPMAVVQGRYCGWDCEARDKVWGSNREDFKPGPSEESFELLKVFYPRARLESIYSCPCDDDQPHGWYSGTPYGPIDIVPLSGPPKALDDYRALAFLGWNTFTTEDFARIAHFVEKGGTLLLARPHLSTDTRRFQPAALPTSLPVLEQLLGGEENSKSKVVRKVGKGTVIYFPQDAYPSEECIRSAYEEELRKLGEEMVQFETARGWLRG